MMTELDVTLTQLRKTLPKEVGQKFSHQVGMSPEPTISAILGDLKQPIVLAEGKKGVSVVALPSRQATEVPLETFTRNLEAVYAAASGARPLPRSVFDTLTAA